MTNVLWLDTPEGHDYPAAYSFLNLILGDNEATAVIEALKVAPVKQFKAKDIMRASRLPALDENNRHVAKDLKKIKDGTPLSPILLVRGDAATGVELIIADGYHRSCAAYLLDENVEIPAQIVSVSLK